MGLIINEVSARPLQRHPLHRVLLPPISVLSSVTRAGATGRRVHAHAHEHVSHVLPSVTRPPFPSSHQPPRRSHLMTGPMVVHGRAQSQRKGERGAGRGEGGGEGYGGPRHDISLQQSQQCALVYGRGRLCSRSPMARQRVSPKDL